MKNILQRKRLTSLIIIIAVFLSLTNCGPKGHREKMHGDHNKKNEYKILTKNDIKTKGEHSFNLNNGTEEQYESAANLSG